MSPQACTMGRRHTYSRNTPNHHYNITTRPRARQLKPPTVFSDATSSENATLGIAMKLRTFATATAGNSCEEYITRVKNKGIAPFSMHQQQKRDVRIPMTQFVAAMQLVQESGRNDQQMPVHKSHLPSSATPG
eukprot:365306-Chlamydomonas_euryale.AAC.3